MPKKRKKKKTNIKLFEPIIHAGIILLIGNWSSSWFWTDG